MYLVRPEIPHRLLLITFPGTVGHNPYSLTTDRLPPEVFLWEENYLAQTPIRQIGCDLHRMSVTGNPFRHVRSEHSVAMKVAILFAYKPMSSLSW